MVDTNHENRRREAASWFAKLNQKRVSAAEVKAFSTWRRVPENRAAFRRIETLWEASAELAGDADIAALTAETLVKVNRPRVNGIAWPQLRTLGVVGGLVLVLVSSLMWMTGPPRAFSTSIGEVRTVELNDGTRVTLDTGTQINVRMTGDRRMIELIAGQALFDVAADARRPFIVSAGDTQVTAVGTRFNVRRQGSGARVLLVEGEILVRDARSSEVTDSLAPGQQIATTATAPIVTTTDIESATSWVTGRLHFERLPLAEAIAEVNRYTTKPIALEASEFGDIRVSGVFDAGDVTGFVAALTDLYPITSRQERDRIVLTRALGSAGANNS